jgi:hypothetical protein
MGLRCHLALVGRDGPRPVGPQERQERQSPHSSSGGRRASTPRRPTMACLRSDPRPREPVAGGFHSPSHLVSPYRQKLK